MIPGATPFLLVPQEIGQLVCNAPGKLFLINGVGKWDAFRILGIIRRIYRVLEGLPFGSCVSEDAGEFALQFGISNIKSLSPTLKRRKRKEIGKERRRQR